mmetsp:Transcript_7013/g.12705  ORF Transcript_7013/g.12705 Transcript_7013/m.12705 type:complete len:301 (-) Transcript_7013:348-1250(-)|eukprot:CAMPEP_0201611692 /NCGR_PEP_ID=MMETSP0492-20130828/20798_1 /ASSEMBLY_ACC=CAM_ASM_000837 /TAXON_ID=420259 /ORGANISM="Thalassiosira gravida, Strain GMp14c1" /LENGTH=300 /DNA_ID=CAMNT_0048077943 /DNA_START=150 /DNA_END=1052 /DNA_ORIENTATION=+
MFLNNRASTRSILANNENASAAPRSKSSSENGIKKAAFNENAMKTPHRNKKAASSKNGQTTQRRRRALGDISNRKAAGGGGGVKGVVVLKQTTSSNITIQGSLKPGNSKALFPASSTKNRAAQVKFSKTPASRSTTSNKARLGGGSGVKSANSKPKQRASLAEYDGIFGATTRWSNDDLVDESRSPFDLVSEEELNMFSDLRDETLERRKKESDERDRLELERCDKQLSEQVHAVHEVNDRDIAEMGTMFESCAISKEEEGDQWGFLDQKLPWEEEDESHDPAEERRLSGSDPYSLWGDF